MALVSLPIAVSFGPTYSGHVADVGYTIYSGETVVQARTGSGLTETLEDSLATGTYEGVQVFDTRWGTVRIVWDFSAVFPGISATNVLNVTNAFLGGIPGTAPSTSGLSVVQQILFTDTANVWRNSDNLTSKQNGEPVYSLVYQNIPGRYWPTENFDEQQGLGPAKAASVMTSDRWNTSAQYTINSGDLIVLTTTGHPLYGITFKALGDCNISIGVLGILNFSQVYMTSDLSI